MFETKPKLRALGLDEDEFETRDATLALAKKGKLLEVLQMYQKMIKEDEQRAEVAHKLQIFLLDSLKDEDLAKFAALVEQAYHGSTWAKVQLLFFARRLLVPICTFLFLAMREKTLYLKKKD